MQKKKRNKIMIGGSYTYQDELPFGVEKLILRNVSQEIEEERRLAKENKNRKANW